MHPAGPAGIFNLTAPNPETARNFYQTLGKVLNRPAWLHVPEFALKLLLREMADELLLPSQRAVPKRLLQAGFKFEFPELHRTLVNLLK
jgi:NAD dependent epimerase/dehydratase family enzyme